LADTIETNGQGNANIHLEQPLAAGTTDALITVWDFEADFYNSPDVDHRLAPARGAVCRSDRPAAPPAVESKGPPARRALLFPLRTEFCQARATFERKIARRTFEQADARTAGVTVRAPRT
jgi:hypothetical protein